jgi:hypothetical protein
MSVQQSLVESVRQLYAARILPSVAAIKSRFEEVHGGPIDDTTIKHLSLCTEGLVFSPSDDIVIGAIVSLEAEPLGFRGFVDPMNVARDPYPACMWVDFERYLTMILHSGNRRTFTFSKGRHGCATELQRRALPFFQRLVLGELCHIVQLALSTRNLLGYTKAKEIVPWCLSDTGKKARNARDCRPTVVTKDKSQIGFITDWSTLTQVLFMVFTAPEASAMPLSMLKDRVRQAGFELSETAFGFTKLADLLRDTRLQEICQVVSSGGQLTIAPSPVLAHVGPEVHLGFLNGVRPEQSILTRAAQCSHPTTGLPLLHGDTAGFPPARVDQAGRPSAVSVACGVGCVGFPVEVNQLPTQKELDDKEDEADPGRGWAEECEENIGAPYLKHTFLEFLPPKKPQRKNRTAPEQLELFEEPVYYFPRGAL